MAEEKIAMTREGMEKLEKEYRELLDVERPANIEALAAARSQGDLSENADYDAARQRQSEIEARINEIEHIRDHAVIIENKGGSKINLGCLVTYETGGEILKVKIGGTVDADPTAELPVISNSSPLGKALIGKEEGDTVTVETAKPYHVTIISINY